MLCFSSFVGYGLRLLVLKGDFKVMVSDILYYRNVLK